MGRSGGACKHINTCQTGMVKRLLHLVDCVFKNIIFPFHLCK